MIDVELFSQSHIAQSHQSQTYAVVLDMVQQYISQNYAGLLAGAGAENQEDEKLLKRNIEMYLRDNKIQCQEEQQLSGLTNRLFNSMCRYDFLTPYILDDAFILENGIEEINGNAWNTIYVTDRTGTHLLAEHFPSPTHAINTMNALATRLDKTLNESTPKFLGEIRKNIRVACTVSPVVDAEVAVHFSIRIVSLANFTKEQLISMGTISEEGLRFLEVCLEHHTNICVGGATFSGKTATLNYLLSYVARNADNRIGTIEIEAREFNIVKQDKDGRSLNNVFNWCTRESENERQNITSDTLEELILRFSPQIIGIGEMRNKEALITCEVGTTGHTVITTTHSDNAVNTYDRIVMLCKKARMGYDDNTLYKLAIKAFPVICFQKKMQDGSRKIVEIIEGMDYSGGNVIYRTLYRYVVESASKSLVTGKFVKCNPISPGLKEHLQTNEACKTDIELFSMEVGV